MRVDIVGSGIGGLCAGILMLRRGAECTIYERHSRPGGLCTGWRRGTYSFNGCVHWVLGLKPGTSFHDMWGRIADVSRLECIEFDDRVVIEVPEGNGTWHFTLHNDVDRLQEYLLSIGPEDADVIGEWMSAIRLVMSHLQNLPPYPTEPTAWQRAMHYAGLWRMLPLFPFMSKWSRLTTTTFAERFRNPRLRAAVSRLYMEPTGMIVVIMGQAYMAAHVAPYPIGGSEALTDLLAETFLSLGGKLRTGCEVSGIRTEPSKGVFSARHRAVGLALADGTETEADWVCSAADWRWTVGTALGGRFLTEAQKALLQPSEANTYPSYCRIHIGTAQELSHLPHYLRLACDITLPDGTRFDQTELEINNFDPTLAPDGHTTLTVNFTTRKGAWWIALRHNDPEAYAKAKQEIWQSAKKVMENKLRGQIDLSAIEVVDIVTPATYERYTANSLGSSQGWTPMSNQLKRLPVRPKLRGLDNFVMCGHWLEAGGGIPVAMLSALRAEKIICSDWALSPQRKGGMI